MKKKTVTILSTLLLTTSTLMNGQDQGITSTTHGNNIGKIVFANSNQPLAFQNETPSAFKTSFSASENIYARVYVEKAAGHVGFGGQSEYIPGYFMYDLSINGKKIDHKRHFGSMWRHVPENARTYYFEEVTENDEWFKWTSWRFYLLPDLNDEELKYGNRNISSRAFVLALLEQNAGTHTVKLDIRARSRVDEAESPVIASGEFTITLTDQDKKDMAFRYAPPLPKDEWQGGNKEGLLKEIATAFQNEVNEEPILVGIYGRDWNEGTYTATGQKYRKLAGWAVFPKDSDGDGQVKITTFNWVSDYSNAGWTKLRFDSHCNGCPDWDVDLAAVRAKADN